jgi:hypothetical protein
MASGNSPLKVLHGPVNIGNQPWSLSRAERGIGAISDLVVNYNTSFGYPSDRQLSEYGTKTAASFFRRLAFSLTAPFSYDVLHYYFGRTFMLWDDWGFTLGRSSLGNRLALIDANLARRLGKRLFMTLQGCDVRLAGESNILNAWTPCENGRCSAFSACLEKYDRDRRAMIDRLLPLMDRVFYLNPELGRWVPNGTFLPYANVDIHTIEPTFLPPGRRLRIVHAPSDPNTKGTTRIVAALNALSGRFDFELVLVHGKSHSEAMEIYRGADMAIDQILYGWYGGFAVELMAMGKPVAAYIRQEDRPFVPAQLWADLPIIRLRPDRLEEDLAAVLSRPDALPEFGQRARQYVERWHNPQRIALGLLALYKNPSSPLAF